MDGAELLVRRVREAEDLPSVADVDHARMHGGTVLAQAGRGLLKGGLLDVREHDLQAVRREPPRHREADAARRARDDGDLSRFQPHHRLPSGGPSRICCGSS